jgi:hypothetical protein
MELMLTGKLSSSYAIDLAQFERGHDERRQNTTASRRSLT